LRIGGIEIAARVYLGSGSFNDCSTKVGHCQI
jgi:hypothetical protein